jgi:methylthioribose-1-phosphate isomerase
LASLAFAAYIQTGLDAPAPPAFLSSPESLSAHVTSKLDYLFGARPTAVNLGAAIRRLKAVLQSSTGTGKSARLLATDLISEAKLIADEDFDRNKKMSEHGGEWLAELDRGSGGSGQGLNVLTVCNTGSLATSVWYLLVDLLIVDTEYFSQGYGTALGLITYLHEQKKLGKAYYTQTAPYHQGSR